MPTEYAQANHTPFEAYLKLSAGSSHSVLLETAGKDGKSFVACDPFLTIAGTEKHTRLAGAENKQTSADPLSVLEAAMKEHPASWAFGFLSYDYSRKLENLPKKASADISLPLAYFILVDRLLTFEKGTMQIISRDAAGTASIKRKLRRTLPPAKNKVAAGKASANLSSARFQDMVRKAREYIKAGDVYQVDLSQRFTAPIKGEPLELYRRLREINPSPFCACLNFGGIRIASSSPERLIKVSGSTVETRPIAGTKKRSKDPKEDRAWAQNLRKSPKERAEHIMMVDLARNDIGKVCKPGSVRVDELMSVEKYSHVQHIVSNVKGTLSKGRTCFDALKAIFPGGTITGAPKIRAMEIIEELEPARRNLYTGSIGYFSPEGEMDFNIAIRTILAKDGRAHFQTGAGIVYDSNPKREYEETMHKAKAMMNAIGGE